jgi:hypothetical protein
MKKQISPNLFVPAVFFIGLFLFRIPPPANQDETEMKSLEHFLRKARVVSINKNVAGGRTAPWVITLEEGKTRHFGMFKYIDEPRPSPLPPTSYKYELAAYELAKLLGVEIVPPVVEREIDGQKGSLQIYLENCIDQKNMERKKLEPPDPQAFANALEDVKVFENLTRDVCMNKGDTYIHKETWKVCRVDFGDAFDDSPELLPDCEISRCSRRLFRGLAGLNDDAVREAMEPYLNDKETEALIQRKNLIVEKLNKLIEEKGEDAVLFS